MGCFKVSSTTTNISDISDQRLTFFEYFYVLVLIIYAGQGSTFVRNMSFSENLIGASIPIILTLILLIKWKISLDKQFYKIIFGLLLYFICITIKYQEIHPSIFINYFTLFFIVYALVKVLDINFFIIYETLIFYLALISLGLWGIQTVLGGDTLLNLLSKIPGIQSFSFITGEKGGVNIIIYSVQTSASSLLYKFPIPRNCGFAWEPGGFAVYLCLAIFVNLFITNFKNGLNRVFGVLLIALVSTFSTTGYSIFIVLLLFYFFNKGSNILILILPILIIAMISIFSLPFMSDKIITLIKETTDIDYIVWKSIGSETGSELQRFSSFLISFRDFIYNPLLGTAGIDGENWYSKIGANISPISGLGNLLAMFGSVGFLFFSIICLRTSFLLSKYFKYKGRFLLFIIILFISISYTILLLPLIMGFWMFSYFAKLPLTEYDIGYAKEIY